MENKTLTRKIIFIYISPIYLYFTTLSAQIGVKVDNLNVIERTSYSSAFNTNKPVYLNSPIDTTIKFSVVVNYEFTQEFDLFKEIPASIKDLYLDTLNISVVFQNGLKTQVHADYHNGATHRIAHFNKYGKHHTDIIWFKNGSISDFAYYENGKLIGQDLTFYENGSIKQIKDKRSSKSWYMSGKLGRETTILDSISDAFREVIYSESGNIVMESVYNNGIQQFIANYPNGDKQVKGKINGMHLFQVGKWEFWYESGIKEKEIHYHDSIPNYPVGTWKYWDENGNLVKEEIYENGELADTKKYLPMPEKK